MPTIKNPPPCIHCRWRPGNYARGLCSRCHARGSIRSRYASKFPNRKTNVGLGLPEGKEGKTRASKGVSLPEPTQALPGSEEKIRVLQDRVRAGQSLWHPLDGIGYGGVGLRGAVGSKIGFERKGITRSDSDESEEEMDS